MLQKTFFLLILFFPAQAVSAVSLEEIDLLHRKGKTFADYKKVEILIRQNPKQKSATLRWRLARTYFSLGKRSGNYREKKKYFTLCRKSAASASALNSRSAEGYYFKALCLGKLGQIKGMLSSMFMVSSFKKNMEKAVKLDPSVEHGGAHRALGKYYAKLPSLFGRNLKKSINHLKKAIRYGPAFADNYFFLAESYHANGNSAAARSTIQAFLKTIEGSPDEPGSRGKRRKAQKLLKMF